MATATAAATMATATTGKVKATATTATATEGTSSLDRRYHRQRTEGTADWEGLTGTDCFLLGLTEGAYSCGAYSGDCYCY